MPEINIVTCDPMPDTLDLDALSALREAATPEPWEVEERYPNDYDLGGTLIIAGEEQMYDVLVGATKAAQHDAAYIVALANAAPTLIATIRDLRTERDAAVLVVHSIDDLINTFSGSYGTHEIKAYSAARRASGIPVLANLKGAC